MQNIPSLSSIPGDMDISQSELSYFNKYNEDIFRILNEEYPAANLMDSDHLICYLILLCRYNNYYPTDIREFIPHIIHINQQKPELN